ncbi:MAG: imidazole glycerol phosphate synthase, glutamine amidotransferase subunit [Fibrobacteres bacterium]|nr:imidazole glycerol phosphate synthase, glutamine amidotransferase subunit [Fibrobacterota bacterium]
MIVIVDYKAGNLTSVKLALEEVGEDAVISADAAVIAGADRLIFPGVGAAGSAMEELNKMRLAPVLKDFIATGKPFLGICVGCQIIMEWSLEDGRTPCLGFLPGGTDIFTAAPDAKVPHMGWNQVRLASAGGHGASASRAATVPHPVFEGIPDGSEFYFVHSYFPTPRDPADVLAETEFGGKTFASVLGRGNLVACQFHVEKSGKWGLALLKNFCKWSGSSTWNGGSARGHGPSGSGIC